MFGLTSGELFIVLFILSAVVSAPLWPRLGAAVYSKLFGGISAGSTPPGSTPPGNAPAGGNDPKG